MECLNKNFNSLNKDLSNDDFSKRDSSTINSFAKIIFSPTTNQIQDVSNGPNVKNTYQRTPISDVKDEQMMQLLIEAGADRNI